MTDPLDPQSRVELGSPEFWERLARDPKRLAAEVCFIDVVNLETTLQRHPSLRAWVTAAYEAARIDEERAKWEVTKAYSRALLDARAATDPHTNKPKVADVLKAEATVDPRHDDATETLLDVQRRRGALGAMVKSLDNRNDMLVQLSANQRKERTDYQ